MREEIGAAVGSLREEMRESIKELGVEVRQRLIAVAERAHCRAAPDRGMVINISAADDSAAALSASGARGDLGGVAGRE